MSKGIWVRNLIQKTITKQISILDSMKLVFARIQKKPINLSVFGLEFTEVDHILWSILIDICINNIYTPQGFEIHPDDIVVDIGAHQGVFTAYAAQRTRGIVKAYEPNSENFTKLCSSVRRNKLGNVEPHQFAVAGSSGEGLLGLSRTSSTHNLIKTEENSHPNYRGFEKVKTKSLDIILQDLDHVDFLKIDCEGAELEIFLSAELETLKKIKRISAEIHYAIDDSELKKMIEKLRKGYSSIDVIMIPGTNLGYLYAKH